MADHDTTPDQTAPGGQPAKEEEKVDVAELQRQLDTEKQLREAAERERERWHQTATAKPAEKQPEEAPDLDEMSEADLVEIISSNDKGKFSKLVKAEAKKLLKEMGVANKADVEQLVDGKFQAKDTATTGMAELVSQYPDLQDAQSELYQEAARQLDLINKDKSLGNLPDFGKVKMATRLAAAELGTGGKSNDKAEAARVARIAAQHGSTSSRNSGRREESTDLNADEKLACTIYGVSEDAFKKNKAEMTKRR